MATEKSKVKDFSFWFEILKTFVLGLRKFEGTPFDGVSPCCNSAYINRLMIDYGYAFAFKNDDGDFFIAPASKVYYNYMFLPKEMLCADYRIVGSKPIKRTVGKNYSQEQIVNAIEQLMQNDYLRVVSPAEDTRRSNNRKEIYDINPYLLLPEAENIPLTN